MTATAELIKRFKNTAKTLDDQSRTLPVWGLDPEAAEYWESEGAVYRLKDYISDSDYSWRYERAAQWLEERASGATLAALYPDIVIK
jgi:hypothetical protein